MNFKLKFHTSAPTTLEAYEIMANIQFVLKDKKYIVRDVTGRSVSFYDNPWRMRWNFEPHMLDGGGFILSDDTDHGNLLTLNYYWSYTPFLFICAFMVIISISNKTYDAIWFFGIFYAVVVPIDIMRSKGKASELLAEVLRKYE